MGWRIVVVTAVSFAALLSGCQHGTETPATSTGEELTSAYEAPSVYFVSQEQIRKMASEVPDPQRAFLTDFKVNRAEVTEAFRGLSVCMRGAGLTPSKLEWDPVSGTRVLYEWKPTRSDLLAEVADSRAIKCEDTFLYPIAQIFASNEPEKMREGLYQYTRDCLAAHEAPSPVTDERTFGMLVGARKGRAAGETVEVARGCVYQGVKELYPEIQTFPMP